MARRAIHPGLPHWTVFSPGYRVVLVEPKGTPRHAFCGAHRIPGAWCFYGDHPLLRLLSLDAADERLGLDALGVPVVHLLYCWRCDIGDLDYRLERDGAVAVLGEAQWKARLAANGHDLKEVQARLRAPETDFPYPGYPAAFPLRSARLTAVVPAEQAAIVKAEQGGRPLPPSLARANHQVGGLPWLVQGSSYVPACGGCGKKMAFVASIADGCADPRGFTHNDGVQVLFFACPACRRVHAFNMAD